MPKPFFLALLFLLLFSQSRSVFADQYDDCVKGCNENSTTCENQASLTAGNVQEEQDSIAACQKNKTDCVKACSDAEAQPQPPAQEQPQSPDTGAIREPLP